MRNPWGRGEWKGEWSDDSKIWTPSLRQALGCTKVDDGVFFMPFKDYLSHFDGTSICVENDIKKYVHSSIYNIFDDDASEPPQAFFKFKLEKAIDL